MYSPAVTSGLDIGQSASGAPVGTEALKRCLPACWGRPPLRVLRCGVGRAAGYRCGGPESCSVPPSILAVLAAFFMAVGLI